MRFRTLRGVWSVIECKLFKGQVAACTRQNLGNHESGLVLVYLESVGESTQVPVRGTKNTRPLIMRSGQTNRKREMQHNLEKAF